MSSNKRDIDIDWRLFSLAYKNGELKGEKAYANHMPAHRVVRVMMAASKEGASLHDLYTNFGIQHFLNGEEYSDKLITSILEKLNLDKSLIKATDDRSLDKAIIASSESALKIVGQDIGVPTIVFIYEDGRQTGFFGPVLKELPDQDESVKLWDSLVELSKHDGFYELKRGRNSPPDVYSTAKC